MTGFKTAILRLWILSLGVWPALGYPAGDELTPAEIEARRIACSHVLGKLADGADGGRRSARQALVSILPWQAFREFLADLSKLRRDGGTRDAKRAALARLYTEYYTRFRDR